MRATVSSSEWVGPPAARRSALDPGTTKGGVRVLDLGGSGGGVVVGTGAHPRRRA